MMPEMYATPYHDTDISQKKFLITGGAGFIGSNIVEYLLRYGAGYVRVLDNLSNGHYRNISEYTGFSNFEFIEGDIRDGETCKKACDGIDYVSHQAALGSVPRSIQDPVTSNDVNISGFLNMLVAVKDSAVERMVYAASSSTYGDSQELPKIEDRIGKPLSPYAVTKFVNELYADVFAKTYGTNTIGLRYFNIYGPRQDPNGAYAAVMPLFIKAILNDEPATINGMGDQTRDFTFVSNAVQANIKALTTGNESALNNVYNIACAERISLNDVWNYLNEIAGKNIPAIYASPRRGDIKDSLANIDKASALLNYQPEILVRAGLEQTFNWFKEKKAI